MRLSFTVLTVVGAIASANAVVLPACANLCIAQANLGGCLLSDEVCLCQSPIFLRSSGACIEATCSPADVTAATSASEAICAAVGVTLTPASTTGAVTATAVASVSKAGAVTATARASTAGTPASGTGVGAADPASSSGSTSGGIWSKKSSASSYRSGIDSIVGLAAVAVAAVFALQ